MQRDRYCVGQRLLKTDQFRHDLPQQTAPSAHPQNTLWRAIRILFVGAHSRSVCARARIFRSVWAMHPSTMALTLATAAALGSDDSVSDSKFECFKVLEECWPKMVLR